jgi:MFS family permease
MNLPKPLASPIVVALAGMLSLAVAMGIGRFAFTPLLPMMLHDGVIDLPGASWLATANYLGYWLGAMACAVQPWVWSRFPGLRPVVHTTAMRLGLALTVVLTLGMALHWPAAWPLWRFLAGIASALVFVYTSGWCLARLAAAGAPRLAGVIFVGPGLGIAVSGLAATAMVAGGVSAAAGWAALAVLALVLTAVVWPQLQGAVAAATPPAGLALLAVAYGLAGFGYIVTATFLPVIARQTLPGSIWLDLFWPLFGLGVALGALITIRFPPHWDRRHLLMGCYALQAAGIMLGVWWPSLPGFALGSLLIGLPFTAITLFAMQEVRRVRPHGISSGIGLLTAMYGLGQIAGPPWVAVLLGRSATAAHGFALSLETAAASLVLGVLLYGWLAKRHPVHAH